MSTRSIPRNGTVKGFFAEAIKVNGIFISWFAGKYFANCHGLWRAIGFCEDILYETAAFRGFSFY